MRKKKVLRFLCVVLMAVLLSTSTVFAAEPTASVIDTNLKGSLTLIKYENKNSDADDTDPGIGSVPGEEGTTGDVHVPIPDVTYTIYRIADIVQGHLDTTGNSVSIEYRSLIKDATANHNTIPIPSGLTSPEDLNTFVNGLRDSADPSKRIGNLDELDYRTGMTDEDGVVKFENLPLGVYVVYEESYPALITDPQCFVVSIPTTATNDGNDGASQPDDDVDGDNMAGSEDHVGMYWDYDIIARPKNATKDISVEKHIVADEGDVTSAESQATGVNDPTNDVLTDTEDYEIGDTIRYSVQVEVPKNIGEMMYFFLEDRLSSGQTFVNDTLSGNSIANMQVWGEPVDGGDPVFIPRQTGSTVNWTVTDPSAPSNQMDAEYPITEDTCRTFYIYFNTQSLSEQAVNSNLDSTKRVPLYSKIWVTFNVTLNEDAIIGAPGNPNDIALHISHTTTSNAVQIPNEPNVPDSGSELDTINPQCPDTKVYTYQVAITKKGEGVDDMQSVEFELRDSRGSKISVSKDENGYYVDKDAAQSEIITIGSDNMARIRGLESGMYQIVETKTLDGYNLLREPIVLTITSDAEDSNLAMQYEEDVDGDYFQIEAGRGYFIEQDGMKLQINLDGHAVGSYVAVEGEVKSYDLATDTGTMDQDVQTVTHRYSYRWTDDEDMSFTANYPMENGVISFTVTNRKGFEIPSTGGIGTWPFVAGGTCIILLGAIGGILMSRKKRKA